MPSRALASLPVLAIVGRPNVGKSTIFNRFVGKRQAIVEDRARTTRDRMYGDMEWNGRRFVIVDTGGLEVDTDDPIEIRVQEQARLAIREADVILFIVDAVSGLTPADLEAAELLRTAKAPVIVVVNKVDNTQREADAAEFWSMGWEETYSISASHGRGTGDLLDAIVWALPPESETEIARKKREVEADEWAREVDTGRLEPYVVGDEGNPVDPTEDEEAEQADLERFEGGTAAGGQIEARWDAAIEAESDDVQAAIAFVGRPNVGKSSLLNSLLGEDRAIVSEVPGTTRDAVDTTLEWGRSEIVLIDTAGIRRRGKVANGPAADKYSTLRSLKAIARADVAVLVIDAVEGLTAQDAHVAGYVVEEGRGLVIAVNKWDLVEDKTDRTFAQYTEWIRSEVPFLEFAPIVSISAKTGQRVGKVLELAIDIWGERRKRISTGELNRVLRAAAERQSPPVVKGRRPKLFYGTQAAVAPPTFVFFANDAALIHFSYRRYIENRLREEFGFDGTPIKLVFRDRESVKLPRRRSGAQKNAVSKGPGARRPASGGRPTPGAKPAAGGKSGSAGKAASGTRPTSGGKPTPGVKPASGGKPVGGATPTSGGRPATK